MSRAYLPVLMLLAFLIVNGLLIVALSALLKRSRPNPVKQTAYESGIPALGDARERFSVKFYMIAMLFIIFDIETVFMIPWAVHYRELSCASALVNGACPAGALSFFGLGEMLVFMAILQPHGRSPDSTCFAFRRRPVPVHASMASRRRSRKVR